MPTKEELKKQGLTHLAMLCTKVCNDPAHYTWQGAEEALKLRTEWASLQTPPESSLKEQQAKEARLLSLHKRMTEFLAGIL